MTSAATGRLIRKMSRQLAAWTSQPPTNGPAAVATPLSPDHAPIARDLSSGWNEASRIARLPGVSSAAPTPCKMRAVMRAPGVGAIAQSVDASANHTTPARKTRRRP
jgi:hypothetical protein